MKTHILLATCAASVLTMAASGALAAAETNTSGTTVGELVVTAERRQENLQDTPVAVSAFTAKTLAAKGLNGGEDLLLSVPNANYTRTNFGGFNFKIRGVGTDVIGFSGTTGVSINENEMALGANHFADTDFYDVERVEVLRGPQGTLYGRNATGGAVDIITNKPTQDFGGYGTVEYGNYDTWKVSGAVNIPLGDAFALRVAGIKVMSDGFGMNTYLNQRVDGRDLGSLRATLSFKPNDRFSAYLMAEFYGENDTRNRVGKQLCIPDPGPSSVGGVPVGLDPSGNSYGAFLNQGCIPGPMNSAAAYGNYNSLGTLSGTLANLMGLATGNWNANTPMQDRNLHDIQSQIQPLFTANQTIIQFHAAYNVTSHLTLINTFGFNQDSGESAEDYNRIVPAGTFSSNPSKASILASYPEAYWPYIEGTLATLFPNGVVQDPQIGTSNIPANYDYGTTKTKEYSDEVRLQSSFTGKLNFSAGLYYSELTAPIQSSNYDVESNALTAYSEFNNALYNISPALAPAGGLINIGNAYPPDGSGHNYYDAAGGGGYLKTYAGFAEVYYQLTPDLKLTLGGRYNVDELRNLSYPISLLSATPNGNPAYLPYSGGFPVDICTTSLSECVVPQEVTYKEFTGRAIIDWTPTLSFTNKTLIYASYSRGYKGGGFNTPCQAGLGATGSSTAACGYPLAYNPEFIDAYEIGTKNTLLNGSMTLNLTGFYYNYTGYQVSRIVSESSVNENINTKIYGAEFEDVWEPVHNLALNVNVGYLHTRIDNGQTSIDSLNLTQGDPNYTLVKETSGSNCLASTADVAGWMEYGLPAVGLGGLCTNTLAGILTSQQLGPSAGADSFGVPVQLGGKQMPNSPHWTVSAGVQYMINMSNDWTVTPRVDYYWQDMSYARIYNAINDILPSYHVVNASIIVADAPMGIELRFFMKNVFNAQPITGTYVTDPTSALFTNVFTLDPRTYGVALTKRF